MRKPATLFLLLIYLFNLGGYRLWYYFQEQKSDERIVAILDKEEYEDADLITFKIPLSLPYQTNWKEFERTDGEVEIQGRIYKFVKRKVENGELVLLCIPHYDKMKLNSARDDFFKYANDLTQNTNSNKKSDNTSGNFKSLGDYYPGASVLIKNSLAIIYHKFNFQYSLGNIVKASHLSPEQPPDFIS